MAKLILDEVVVTPSPPPAGAISLYAKTDDVVYVQDSSGNEVPIGTPDAITDLTGDVSATGPGSVAATVNSVGGKTASEIAQSVDDTQDATSSNTPNTIVKRGASGEFSAGVITASLNGNATNVTGIVAVPNGGTGLSTAPANGQLLIGNGTNYTLNTLTGTANQVIVSVGAGTITLSLPQSIATTSSPTFAALTVTGTLSAGNFSGSSSGTNTGDVTISDTNSIDLTLVGQLLSADLKLSADAASVSNLKATTTIHADGLHIEYLYGTPVQIGTSNFVGAASGFALYDHVHSHGNQTNATLHAVATSIANGFMSSTDKAKIDAELPTSIGTSNQVLGVNNAGTAGEYKSLVGTTNQIIVTHGVGTVTFSTPQDIATSSSPSFTNLTVSSLTSGSVVFAGTGGLLSQNNANFYWDNSNLALGIGTIPAVTAVLDIVNNSGSTKAIQVTGYGSNVGFRGRRANGTLVSPTQSLTGDNITFFSGRGYGATGFAAASTGSVNIVAAENFTDTTMATYLSFNTTPTTSVTSAERMRISQAGNVLIGTTTDSGTEKLQVNGAFISGVSTLIDAANIATDASLGNLFTLTIGGNRNLSAPTNPSNGKKITYRITQDGTGNRTLTYDAIFRFGLDVLAPVLSTGANKTDYIGFIYNSSATKWDCVALAKGF